MPTLNPPTANLSTEEKAHLFDILNDTLKVGFSVFDQDNKFVFISNTSYEQLKLTPDDLVPGDTLDKCFDLIKDKKNAVIPKIFTKLDNSGESTKALVRSSRLEIENRTYSITRREHHSGMICSMAHDISDLVEKEALLENSLALGQSGYWSYDLLTKEHTLSKSMHKYFDEQTIELINKNGILGGVHPDHIDMFKTAIANAPKNGDRFDVKCRSLTLDGSEQWNRTTGEIIRDREGKAIKIRAFVRDITHEHNRAKAFEDAKEAAIEASRAKSEFLANMSHEIRTPMNGVLGMAELLEQSDITPRQRDYIKVITRSSEALLTIINDILDFSKIEAGAFEFDPIPFNLRDSIDDVFSLLAIKAHEKNLELIIDYAPDIPSGFIADAGRIRQVITNLIGNAVKFTETGHILLSVALKEASSTSAKLSIAVSDTGIGIEKDKLDKVFNKFTQADGSTTRVYGGTGLGLTISKRIIDLMDGDIRVESTLGEGSTFDVTLTLPIDESAVQTVNHTNDLIGYNVLIVDDIAVNRQILTERFESWQMRTTSACDAPEALNALKASHARAKPFDLIVLDYLMPGLNGGDLAQIISTHEHYSSIPIVMLSSCDQPMTTAQLREINIMSYLMKPVRENRLMETLCEVLSNVQPAAQLTATAQQEVDTPPGDPLEGQADRHPPVLVPSSLQKTEVSRTLQQIEEVFHELEENIDPEDSAPQNLTPGEPAQQMHIPEPHIPETRVPESYIPVPRPPEPQSEVHRPSSTHTGSLSLLVAEDFPLNQEVVAMMLEDSDYSPEFADNGQIAVNMFKDNPGKYAAVLMDVSMPVMDGYEASEIIKSIQKLTCDKPIPIIALTGHALKNDREKCLDSHMDDYLTKPVKQVSLIDTLDKWVKPDAQAQSLKRA